PQCARDPRHPLSFPTRRSSDLHRPFTIGSAGGEHAVFVDLADARVASEGEEGDPVFKPHGGNAPALEAGLDALRVLQAGAAAAPDRKSTRLNSSHVKISYAVFC